MFNKTIAIFALAVAMFVTAFPTQANNGGGSRIIGSWHTQANRNGSVVARPVIFLFHADGTMQYVSSTSIHSNATATPDIFSGRSGGMGVYHPVQGKKNTYQGYTEELMYDEAGNAKGRFLVEFTFTLSKIKGTASNVLDGKYRFKITSFTPANLGAADVITGETVELSDGGSPGELSGYRLETSCYFTNDAQPCHEGPVE